MGKRPLRERLLDIRDDMIDTFDEHIQSRNNPEAQSQNQSDDLYTRGFGQPHFGPVPQPTSGKPSGERALLNSIPPLVLPRRSRNVVALLETLSTFMFLAILLVPLSRVAAEFAGKQNADPDNLWIGTDNLPDFDVMIAAIAVMAASGSAHRIGNVIGTASGISRRSLTLLFVIAILTGLYGF